MFRHASQNKEITQLQMSLETLEENRKTLIAELHDIQLDVTPTVLLALENQGTVVQQRKETMDNEPKVHQDNVEEATRNILDVKSDLINRLNTLETLEQQVVQIQETIDSKKTAKNLDMGRIPALDTDVKRWNCEANQLRSKLDSVRDRQTRIEDELRRVKTRNRSNNNRETLK